MGKGILNCGIFVFSAEALALQGYVAKSDTLDLAFQLNSSSRVN